jgi:hypothetical protein
MEPGARDREQTLGQKRVRANFNPSDLNLVDVIKVKTAELIDLCLSQQSSGPSPSGAETIRHWALAMTAYEEAAMWAVKAATAGK